MSEPLEAFYDALDASGDVSPGDYDRSRSMGWVDSNAPAIVAALLEAGWRAPGAVAETNETLGLATVTLAQLAEIVAPGQRLEPTELLARVERLNTPTTPGTGLVGALASARAVFGPGTTFEPASIEVPVPGGVIKRPAKAAETPADKRSQRIQLLEVFTAAGPGGLTDEEAAQRAGLFGTLSCWWKRCGELRGDGWIEYTGANRMGAMARSRKVSRAVERKGRPS